MVEALTTLACASPANCFFQVSKPAALLPHCAALALPDIPYECHQDANGAQLELPHKAASQRAIPSCSHWKGGHPAIPTYRPSALGGRGVVGGWVPLRQP